MYIAILKNMITLDVSAAYCTVTGFESLFLWLAARGGWDEVRIE